MRKRSLIVLVLAFVMILGLGLVACDNNGDEKPAPTPEETITWGEWEIVSLPTLDVTGQIKRKNNKGEEMLIALPSLNSDKYKKTIVKEPTPDSQGEIIYSITTEYGDYAFSVTTPKQDVIWGEWTSKILPTLDKSGEIYRVNNLGEKETFVLPALSSGKYIEEVIVVRSFDADGVIKYTINANGSAFVFEITSPKYTLTRVPRVEPTVNSRGNIEYYKGTDGKLYRDASHSEEITIEDTILLPIGITYVEEVKAEYGKNGTKAHYVDDAGNKFVTNEVDDFIKVEDESTLVIPELKGMVYLVVNDDVDRQIAITHLQSEEITEAELDEHVADLSTEEYLDVFYTYLNADGDKVTIKDLAKLCQDNQVVTIHADKWYLLTLKTTEGTVLDTYEVVYGYTYSNYDIYNQKYVPEGYEFETWAYDVNKIQVLSKTTPIKAGNHDIYRIINVNYYPFIIHDEILDNDKKLDLAYGTELPLPTDLVHADYKFGGYYLDAQFVNENTYTTMPSKGLELFIKWIPTYDTNIKFELFEDTYGVTSYTDKNATSIVVPDTFMGKKVTYIGNSAFMGMDKLESVTLGNNIELLGAGSFANCVALKRLVGPNVKTILGNCIQGIDNIELISLPKVTTVSGSFISSNKHIGRIELDSLESLVSSAIRDNQIIDEISLPKALHFNENAIMGNGLIGSIELGASTLDHGNPFLVNGEIENLRINAKSSSAPRNIAKNVIVGNIYADANILGVINGFKVIDNLYVSGTKLCTGALTDDSVNISNVIIENSVIEAESNAVNLSTANVYLKIEYVPVKYANDWNNSRFGYRIYSESEPSAEIVANSTYDYWHYNEDGSIATWITNYSRGIIFEQVGDAYVVSNYTGSSEYIRFHGPYMGKPVIGIKENVFSGKNILQVTVDNNITIGANAFKNCAKLYAIIGADKITAIGSGAFSGCTSLASADIFTGIDTIETGVFEGCTNIKSVNMPNIKTLKAGAFKGNDLDKVTLTSVETIEADAFSGSANISAMDLPNVKTLAPNAFNGTTIDKMTMNTAAVIAANGAFNGAKVSSIEVLGHNVKALQNVDKIIVTGDTLKTGDIVAVPGNSLVILSNSVVNAEMYSITSSADQDILLYLNELPAGFVEGYNEGSNNILLLSETEPTYDMWAKNVDYFKEVSTGIKKYVLDYTRGLEFSPVGEEYAVTGYTGTATELVIPDTYLGKMVTSVTPATDNGMGIELTKVTLGANVKTLGYGAFKDNYMLSEILGLDSVVTIGDNALFSTALTTLTLNNVESIGVGGLAMCTQLTTVVAPKLVNIGIQAFSSDGALNSITMTGVKSVGDEAFIDTAIKDIDISTLTIAGNNIFSGLTLDTLFANNASVDGFGTDVLGNVTIKAALVSTKVATKLLSTTNIDILQVEGESLAAGNINVQNNIKKILLSNTVLTAVKDAIVGTNVPVYLMASKMPVGYESGFAGANKVSLYSKTAPTADQWAEYGYYYYMENDEFKEWTLEYTKGLLFEVAGSDNVISGYTGTATEIIIPTIYDGKKVVGIKDNAFNGKNTITSVELSAEMTSIGQGAFEGCSALTTIKGLEKVTSIGANAFSGIGNADNLVVNATTIGANAFSGDTIGALTLNASVIDNIDVNALAGVSITTLNIDGNIASRALSTTSVKVENVIGTNLAVDSIGNINGLTRVYIRDGIETAVVGAVKAELAGVELLIENSVIPAGFAEGWNASAIKPALFSATEPTADQWVNYDNFYSEDEAGNISIWPLPNYTVGLTFAPLDGGYAVKSYLGSATEVIVPDTYLGKPVSTVGQGAFMDNKSITKVTLGANVKTLELDAFKNCSLLSTIVGMDRLISLSQRSLMGTAITSFNVPLASQLESDICAQCKQLTSVNMPKLNFIPNGMFAYCSALQTIDLANKEIIGIDGFKGCSNLTDLGNTDAVISIENSAFSGTGIVNVSFANLKNIDRMTFDGCTSLTSFSAPELIELGDTSTPTQYVFDGCTSLTTLNIPKVRYIYGGYSFRNTGITSIDLTNVIEISGDAFLDAKALTTVSNYNMTSVPSNAFNNCSALTSLSLPNVTSIAESAFYGCAALTTVSMPNVETINAGAFCECAKLNDIGNVDKVTTLAGDEIFKKTDMSTIDMPALTTISGARVFMGLTKLTSVSLPNLTSLCKDLDVEGVENDNNFIFRGCSALESVSMPKLTYIGGSVFEECTSLTTLDMPMLERINSELAPIYGSETMPELTFTHPETITKIGSYALAHSGIANNSFPNVTIVDEYGLQSCPNLKSVDLPKVESVGTCAFMNNTMDSINLPLATSVKGNAFVNAVIGELTMLTADVNGINREMLAGATITTFNINSAMLPKIYDCSNTNVKNVHITGGDLGANSIRSDKGVTNIILDETVVNAVDDTVSYYFKGTVFLMHASIPTTFAANWNRYNKPVLIYSADDKGAGYWHYVDKTPTPWA